MYYDFVVAHFEHATFRPPPLDNFWEIVEELDWPTGGQDAFAERAHARLSLCEALQFEWQLNRVGDVLQEAAVAAVKASRDEPDAPFWDQDLWDAARHVVGLGRQVYEGMLENPGELLGVDAEWGLGFIINAGERAVDADPEELDRALRLGAEVRAHDEPDGYGRSDVIEHPDHGLGFVSFDLGSPWMWLVFRDETLSTRRHDTPERWVTLYRDTDDGRLEFWYGGVGRGSRNDIFTRSGSVGYRHGGHIVPPSDEADARFDALVAQARGDGFEDRELPRGSIAVRVGGFGLAEDPLEIRDNLDRMLRETGLGDVTSLRAGRDESVHFAQVVDAVRASQLIHGAWDDPPELSVFDVGGDQPKRLDEEALAFELPTPPCEVHEALPYFSRLSITPHPETAAWAVEAAAAAGLEALEDVDDRIETLRERHQAGNLDEHAVTQHCERLAAFAGEALRARVGGAWGVGTLFTERLWYGFLVGDAKIRWWPVREVQSYIVGDKTGSFVERCHDLAERSKTTAFAPEADRLFTLAAGEGYFDAGVSGDGRQVLMDAFYGQTFALFFDDDGRLLEYATRPPIPGRPEGQPDYGPSRMALERWQAEIGFEPRDIKVRRFSCRAAGVGIEDLPSHFEEFLEDPDSFDDEDRAHYPLEINAWLENGDFVLYWGNDLWLDGNGHVTST